MTNELHNRLYLSLKPCKCGTYYFGTIDVVHDAIHNKNYFDYHKVFESVANNGKVYVTIKTNAKEAHLIAIIDVEGKARFKSYTSPVFSVAQTNDSAKIFNRYINSAPTAISNILINGTFTSGTLRFDKLLLGGTGPQSSGTTASQRVETVLDGGMSLTIEITNVSGQAKDIGIVIEWYEQPE